MTFNTPESAPIEKIDSPPRDLFTREYLKKRRPVIIKGAMKNWRAMSHWNQAFFRERFGDDEVIVRNFSRSAIEPFLKTTLRSYIDLFDLGQWEDPARPPYLSDWPAISLHPELSADFQIPTYFDNWFDRIPTSLRQNLNYLLVLIGPSGAVYNLHADLMSTHAWIAQFQGRKKFVLYPPDQGENLHDGEVDPENPDLDAYPKFRNARGRLEGFLEPGEIVFIPANWWHQVTSIGKTLSIVCNFMNADNAAELLGSIRRNWREPVRYFLRAVGLRRGEYYID